ncbi:hypothetical protein KM043_004553 [Ampulex compressa]|nr:hypothetical protein KM043_004553 [Ampulex compressa]
MNKIIAGSELRWGSKGEIWFASGGEEEEPCVTGEPEEKKKASAWKMRSEDDYYVWNPTYIGIDCTQSKWDMGSVAGTRVETGDGGYRKAIVSSPRS